MSITLLRRYGGRVPRYTSYPTAPHFDPAIGAETYGDWLGRIGGGDTLSLYFHVPFCTQMCWYCGCHTKVVSQYDPVAEYAALLRREIGLVAAAASAGPEIVHIHMGGGSPTMLSDQDLARLMETARSEFRFAADAEVAVEIDPRALTRQRAAALAAAGVTRASLGVQDFDDKVLEAVNRAQPYRLTADGVGWLRAAGIEAVNFDLIYGLPHQTVDSVVRTVDLAVGLAPDRLAVFGYAHVPWMKTHQRMIDESALPDEAERLAQSAAVAARLVEHGYRRIGLDHFARQGDEMAQAQDEGRLRRNFQGYTTDRAAVLLGFGASAIGALAEGYVQNAVPFGHYADAIGAGALAVSRGVRLDDDDRLRRAIIERLMCDLTVDLEAQCAAHGAAVDGFAEAVAALAPMERDGLVVVDGHRISITEPGRALMRSVCAVFDRYLDAGQARYSQAV